MEQWKDAYKQTNRSGPTNGMGCHRVVGCPIIVNGHQILAPYETAFAPGEWVAVMGGSGAGKSTFLRSLRANAAVRSLLVPNRTVLFEGLSVRETLLGEHPLSLGLEPAADTLVRACSDGERKRVMLAQALHASRGVGLMLLDEPTSGLSGHDALTLVQSMQAVLVGSVVVCVIHQPSKQLLQLFNRIIVVRSGELRCACSPEAFLAGRPNAVSLLDAVRRIEDGTCEEHGPYDEDPATVRRSVRPMVQPESNGVLWRQWLRWKDDARHWLLYGRFALMTTGSSLFAGCLYSTPLSSIDSFDLTVQTAYTLTVLMLMGLGMVMPHRQHVMNVRRYQLSNSITTWQHVVSEIEWCTITVQLAVVCACMLIFHLTLGYRLLSSKVAVVYFLLVHSEYLWGQLLLTFATTADAANTGQGVLCATQFMLAGILRDYSEYPAPVRPFVAMQPIYWAKRALWTQYGWLVAESVDLTPNDLVNDWGYGWSQCVGAMCGILATQYALYILRIVWISQSSCPQGSAHSGRAPPFRPSTRECSARGTDPLRPRIPHRTQSKVPSRGMEPSDTLV